VHECSLDRRKSHDGHTRVKLDLRLTALYIEKIRSADVQLDQSIRELRRLHKEMAREPAADTQVA
jgi:hypothetical protein